MNRPAFGTLLTLASLGFGVAFGQGARNGTNREPRTSPRVRGIRAGDRLSATIEYSTVWYREAHVKSVRKLLRPKARPPGIPRKEPPDLMKLAGKLNSQPLVKDPLYARLNVTVGVIDFTRIRVTPDVAIARYHDSRDKLWELDSKKPRLKDKARVTIEDASVAWRLDFKNRQERERLEEQLLTAALVMLSGRTLTAKLAFPAGDATFPKLNGILLDVLPEEYPPALRENIEWFLRSAVARVLGPGLPVTKPGQMFERRGVAYRIMKSRKGREGKQHIVQGLVNNPRVGVVFKEQLLIEDATGMVREGRSITVHDGVDGRADRFGAIRWRTVLSSFRRQPPRATTGK